jgi:hypothetical protein
VTVGLDAESAAGAQKAIVVEPTAMTSPSRRRRRPVTRSPPTNVPLWERPSSITVQSSPARSSVACTRETSESQSSAIAFAGRRPIVIRSPACASATITWLPAPSR